MDSNTTCDEDSNTTCDEDSNTTCDEDSITTCDEDSNTTCEEDLFGAGEDDSEGEWRGRSGHNYVPTKDVCVLNESIDTQGINSGGSSNDNMASDVSTPQSHAINDGSSVIRNSVIDGVLESSLMVTLHYN